jgi:hypothetical protein
MPTQPLVEASLRLYQRYATEIIETLNVCPFAQRARETGRVIHRVLLEGSDPKAEVLAIAAELAQNPKLEVALLLFPLWDVSRSAFEEFTAEVIQADAARYRDQSAPFAFAAFHPAAKADASKPERLIPFWRRSPDPTLQLVRVQALERVRKGDAPGTHYIDPKQVDFAALRLALQQPTKPELSLRQRITNANHEAYQQAAERLERTFDDIMGDRRRTRDALGLDLSNWETQLDPAASQAGFVR